MFAWARRMLRLVEAAFGSHSPTSPALPSNSVEIDPAYGYSAAMADVYFSLDLFVLNERVLSMLCPIL